MTQEEYSTISKEIQEWPPGIVSVASGFLGRYREFDVCLHHLLVPPGTHVEWALGVNIAFNFNEGIRAMLAGNFGWIWFLGDDHTFNPELLYILMKHNVDVVAPIVLKRSSSFKTVISENMDLGFKSVNLEEVENWHGLVDITHRNVGNAGLLAKRKVFEIMPPPWFENGKTHPEFGGSDLWFCEKLRRAGFKIYVDSDQSMGHITHAFFWIGRDQETGKLKPDIRMVDGW